MQLVRYKKIQHYPGVQTTMNLAYETLKIHKK